MRRAHLGAHSYRAAVMALNPIGYWRLGEASGAVARNETGVLAGTYVGSPTLGVTGLLSGAPNTAVRFDGSAKSVSLGDLGIASGGARTIVAWGKVTDLTDNRYIFTFAASGALFLVTASGALRVYDGNSNLDVAAGVTINAPRMFAAAYDGANWLLGLDGVYLASLPGNAPAASAARIGTFGGSDAQNWIGDLAEVPVWNRALTASEVARLYAVGRGF